MPDRSSSYPITTPNRFARKPAIIPTPKSMRVSEGNTGLYATTPVLVDENFPDLNIPAKFLRDWLNASGQMAKEGPSSPPIKLAIDPTRKPESYTLEITTREIRIFGGDPAGVHYGIQTLIQMAQPWNEPDHSGRSIPLVSIEDTPVFSYRGMHLDVGRHFYPVSFIKRYIDILARYKMNRFHWHLTEDQGWRIEIKKYPRLQEISAFRKQTLVGHLNDDPPESDAQRYGGFYTQEEVREIVEYAQERFVTIIPEIEMPGHAQAAIAAYPELGCTDQPLDVATTWGIFENVYCPTEETFQFLEDVLTEIMELFPGDYIHIGGDECPKTQWKTNEVCQKIIREENLNDEDHLQSWFIQRIERFLNKHGRKLIGWDEILEGGLAPNATVMSWRGESGGIKAAREGHDVIMTPTEFCYFDTYHSPESGEPLAIGGFLPLKKVYQYNPVPEVLSKEEAKHILGAQGNVWTEYMQTSSQVEYMVYPRMQALAEVVWSGDNRTDFTEFVERLRPHVDWMNAEGINASGQLLDA